MEEIQGDGLLQYPTIVRRILEEHGMTEIRSMVVKRTPLSKLLTGAMSAFSLGKFGKRAYKEYDELFHLFCEVKLVDGNTLSTLFFVKEKYIQKRSINLLKHLHCLFYMYVILG